MKMIKLEICGKTKTGSHEETIQSGKDKGQVIFVNDYDTATITVEVPESIDDNLNFYGGPRYAALARNHEIVLLANAVRATLAESAGKPQDEKDALAQAAVKNYPACLDPKPRTPGAAKKTKAEKERAKALTMMEAMLKKAYDKWSGTAKEEFDRTYPVA